MKSISLILALTICGSSIGAPMDIDKELAAIVACARTRVVVVDDGRSDAQTVARWLADACHADYWAMVESAAATREDEQTRRWVRQGMSSSSERTKFFLDYVILYRSEKSKGYKPTPTE